MDNNNYEYNGYVEQEYEREYDQQEYNKLDSKDDSKDDTKIDHNDTKAMKEYCIKQNTYLLLNNKNYCEYLSKNVTNIMYLEFDTNFDKIIQALPPYLEYLEINHGYNHNLEYPDSLKYILIKSPSFCL
jgi:hypothetical protein